MVTVAGGSIGGSGDVDLSILAGGGCSDFRHTFPTVKDNVIGIVIGGEKSASASPSREDGSLVLRKLVREYIWQTPLR